MITCYRGPDSGFCGVCGTAETKLRTATRPWFRVCGVCAQSLTDPEAQQRAPEFAPPDTSEPDPALPTRRAVAVVRGSKVEVGIQPDASPEEHLAQTVETLILCLIALEDPRVDGVLRSLGVDPEDPNSLFR